MTSRVVGCALCESDGGHVVFRCDDFRVVQADEPGFPAFYRLVWNRHVAEFSDLSVAERNSCMAALVALEQTLRQHLQPRKINLASLGNVVPHLHWHVIARFDWDSHFPAPVWSAAQRAPAPDKLATLTEDCGRIAQLLVAALTQVLEDQALQA